MSRHLRWHSPLPLEFGGGALIGRAASLLSQPLAALWAIRLMIGLLPALLVLGGLYYCYQYPITQIQLQTICATQSISAAQSKQNHH